MKLLAIGHPRPGADAGRIARHARGEMRGLWRLYRGSAVREMYSPGRSAAVRVTETANRGEAKAALPLAADRVIGFELIELRPFSAFETLFAGGPPT